MVVEALWVRSLMIRGSIVWCIRILVELVAGMVPCWQERKQDWRRIWLS